MGFKKGALALQQGSLDRVSSSHIAAFKKEYCLIYPDPTFNLPWFCEVRLKRSWS